MPTIRSHSLHRLLSGLVAFSACLAAVTTPPRAVAQNPAPPLMAGATVPWHASLPQARQAAQVSRRPVLVIFTAASAASGATLARDVFPAAETVALLTACFEPVCIDTDADPATGRVFGITSVPSACILDPQDQLLARFDCPVTSAAFVAAVSHAAQQAAVAQSSGTLKPGAMVRESSDFVSQAVSSASPPATATELVAAEEPALPATPPAMSPGLPTAASVWPAETATQLMPTHSAPYAGIAARPSLEPAPAAAPSPTATAWLDSKPASAQVPAAAAPTTPTAEPAPEKKPSASESFMAAIKKPFSIFTKPTQPDVKEPVAAAPAQATTVTASTAAATAPDAAAAAPMPLGLEGYCPVSLVDKGTWVEGRAQWGVRHRGRTYLFAGAEQQRAFLADPDRYAPALSGDDPVLACDSGRQVAGQRRYGVTYQARTYLFSSPETRAAFAADPQRYTTRVTIAERPIAPDRIIR